MKKKLNTVYKLFFTVFSSIVFLSYFGGPPNGYTGAPPTFTTCSNCHSGGSPTGNIMISGMPASIMPNTLYPITVTVNVTSGNPVFGGFQLVVQNGTQNSGTLSNPQPSTNAALDVEAGKTYFEHANALAFGAGDAVTYTVDWTSPSSGSGNITMYAAGNLANGNSQSTGDKIVTTTAVGTLMGGGGTISVNVTGTNVSCFAGTNGTASASASGGGGPPYTYNWSNGASGPNISNLAANTYTVTVTNLSGGQGTGSVIITQPATSLSVAIVAQSNVDCLNPVGSATAQGNGGTPGYTYSWSNGATGQTAALSPGNFTVTVTDANNCTSANSGVIVSNTNPPNAEAGPSMQVSCTNPTATLNGTGSSTGPSISYQWTTGDGQIISGANTLMPVVGMAGTYTLTVTNNTNFCTASDNATVTGNAMVPTANAGPDKILTCTINSVTLDGTGSSTGANITYLWTTANGHIVSGANTATPVVDAVGDYILTVTNTSNNCTQTDQASVSPNMTLPTSAAGNDMVLTCTTTSLQLNGNGSSSGPEFTYLWTTANGNIVSGATTLTPTVNEPGTYCLQVTNTVNGCSATDCAIVTENLTAPVANAGSVPPLTCIVDSVSLDGSSSSSGPDINYLWTTANGNIVSGETTTMPVVDLTGTYTLTVTNTVNGCTASSNVTVNSNTTPPDAEAGPAMALNCNNSSVVLNGTGSSQGGNFSYLWSGPGIESGENTLNPTVNAPGTYSIVITNTNTGCTAIDSTTVTETPELMASIPASTDVDCHGNNTGSANAEGSGGNGNYDYNWSNGTTAQEAINLSAGTYTVTITDEDDCTATSTIIIAQPDELIANTSATGESAAGANDGTATAIPSGGVPSFTYLWSNTGTTQTITGLSAGNYMVTVTDNNGCSTVETVTVSSFNCASFGISISSVNPSCNGNTDGEATATPTGGTGPFTYLWSTGSMNSTVANLSAGTYNVTITDDNDCEITGNVTLSAPPSLNLTVSQQTNVTCNGAATGSATIAASGGTPNYTYDWPGGATGASQMDLSAGSYTVTVTDENDCTATIQVNITQPPVFTGTIMASDETSVGANDGTSTASFSGGIAPYQYNWNNSGTTSTINNLAPGEYCVTVMDANGCSFTGCATVNQFGCVGLSTTISGENVECSGGQDGLATVTASGFEDPITVLWSNGGTGTTIGNLTAATYSVTITDANGCSAIDEIEITEPDELMVMVLTQTNLECPGQMTGAASIDGVGGTPDYTFSWPNGSSNPVQMNLAAGNYEVTISDEHNCSATHTIEIGIDPDIAPPVVLVQNITVSLDATGHITVSPDMVDAGSTDNCGITAKSIDLSQFDCEDIGLNKVILTVQDAALNIAFDSAFVTIVDDILPVITCPNNIAITVDNCETAVDYDEPTVTDNCPDASVAIQSGPVSGGVFPSGTTEVTWVANDNHGNTASCTFTVTVESGFTASATFTAPTCTDLADGSATATPTGGTSPFEYEWDDPASQMTQTATGLPAGEYSVVITDSDGCVTTASVEITEPDPISITIDQVTDETGTNMDGLIKVTVSGGTGTYTYEWLLNGALISNDEDPANLAAGEYVLNVTDQNNCTVTETIIVDQLNAVNSLELGRYVSIYPVPTSGQLSIRLDLPETAFVSISILDLTGRPVQEEVNEIVSTKDFVFDLAEKAAGVYLVRIVAENEVLFKRILVNR